MAEGVGAAAAGDEPVAVVLAAGLGKRMRSACAKVLHPVGGRPMVVRVLAAARRAGLRAAVLVVGHQADAVEDAVAAHRAVLEGLAVRAVRQAEPRGTGDAVRTALAAVPEAQAVLVLAGDAPLLDPEELAALVRLWRETGAAAALLTATLPDPTGYGRLVRDEAGRPVRIVEERDASPAERAIREVFTLVGCFAAEPLRRALEAIRPDNAQGELYLTDVVAWLHAEGHAVATLGTREPWRVLGVNDRRALAQAEAALRAEVLERLMEQGVTVVDPSTTYVADDCVVGPDTVLYPMTTLEGGTRVGPRCRVGPGAHLVASDVAADVRIWYSVVEGSRIGPRCRIGPFSHLRPGTELGPEVEVGNFAELKNARIGARTKQHHHSYLGDADVGEGVNVGAGVITVNYDGWRKHRTVIGDGAFLGCNANLVAPVEVGAGAFVAAGSTIDRPVGAGDLAIARARQENKPGWVERRRRAEGARSERRDG
jgi:bifunctional UDP-N-acetylglucosamine pyrophosphorylase/glucosamine-1-phosphate N-acetyltransferase